MKLNHLHIKADDVAASRRFYERYFGFRLLFEHEGGGCFLIDEANFMLTLMPYKDPQEARLPDWFHMGFCQGSPETVRSLYDLMKFENVEFSGQLIEEADYVVFYCLDPAGNKVEVSWHKEEAHLFQPTPSAPIAKV